MISSLLPVFTSTPSHLHPFLFPHTSTFLTLPTITPSQGPLQHTCGHYWQMIWEQKTAGIVMLNKCVERGMVRDAFCPL